MNAFDLFLRRNMRIYGALRQCAAGDWGRAFTELFITLLFALFAVWVPVLIYPMFGLNEHSISETLYLQVENGELYILTTALLAPVFYFTFPNARIGLRTEARHFPSQQFIILIFVGTVIISALAVAATKVQAIDPVVTTSSAQSEPVIHQASNVTGEGLIAPATDTRKAPRPHIPSRMITWSIWLFFFTSILYFLTLVVRNWLERGGVDEIFDQQSQEQDRRNPPPQPEGGVPPEAPDPDRMVRDTIAAHTVTTDAA